MLMMNNQLKNIFNHYNLEINSLFVLLVYLIIFFAS